MSERVYFLVGVKILGTNILDSPKEVGDDGHADGDRHSVADPYQLRPVGLDDRVRPDEDAVSDRHPATAVQKDPNAGGPRRVERQELERAN